MRQKIYYDRHRRVIKRYTTIVNGREFTFGQILIARRKGKEMAAILNPQ